MKYGLMKITSMVLLGAFILSGCSSFGKNKSEDADPALTQGDTAQFFSKSGAASCAGGAALAATACLLAGGSKVTCAAAAVATCGIAMGANYYLDTQRANYSNTEDRMNAYLNDVQEKNQQMEKTNQVAKSVLTKNEKTLQNLNKEIKKGTMNQEELQKELRQIDANIYVLNEQLTSMKETQKNWQSIAATEKKEGANVAQLDKEIAKMNKQVAVFENQLASIAKQRTALAAEKA